MSLPVQLKHDIEDLCLVKIDWVNWELVECQTLEEAKTGLVAGVHRYAKRIGANTKTINHAAVLKAQWEQKHGDFLREGTARGKRRDFSRPVKLAAGKT